MAVWINKHSSKLICQEFKKRIILICRVSTTKTASELKVFAPGECETENQGRKLSSHTFF